MAYYPSCEELLRNGGASPVLEVRRSLRSILSNLVAFFLAAIGVYVLGYLSTDGRIPISLPILQLIQVRWLAIIPAIILFEIVRKYHDDLYVFEADRITHFEGRLSLTSSVPSVRYQDVRALSVTQDLLGRMFDYGDVSVNTAGSDLSELVLSGVRAPLELATLVDKFRLHNLRVENCSLSVGRLVPASCTCT